MLKFLKKGARKSINALGYEIRGRGNERGFNAEYLSKFGSPEIVIDVGVAFGTHALYEAFPQATFVLIEPLSEYAEYLHEIAKKYKSIIVSNALGERKEMLEINVNPRELTKSSFQSRSALTHQNVDLESRKIEVTTLDEVLNKYELKDSPIFLKIDTEGFELNVLKGGISTLERTEFVIVETSIAKRFESSYKFSELIAFMESHKFQVFDIIDFQPIPNQPGMQFIDLVFKKAIS